MSSTSTFSDAACSTVSDLFEQFDDVEPIEQDDGPNAPVAIAYSDSFKKVMNYFRAIVNKEETSDRALELTEAVIAENASNYSAWQYRRFVLNALEKDLHVELGYLNEVIEENQKNYQVWYHRQALFTQMRKRTDNDNLPKEIIEQELSYMDHILMTDDQKNYHAWAHRQWFVTEFHLCNDNELHFVDRLLQTDFRNNSAWNHRFFVLKQMYPTSELFTQDLRQRELDFAFTFVNKAPNNESVWNYALGIARHWNVVRHGTVDNVPVYEKLRDLSEDLLKRAVLNAHARWVLIECLTIDSPLLRDLQRAEHLCEELIQYDGIRKKYWTFRREQIRQM